jgi:hypothetical protein
MRLSSVCSSGIGQIAQNSRRQLNSTPMWCKGMYSSTAVFTSAIQSGPLQSLICAAMSEFLAASGFNEPEFFCVKMPVLLNTVYHLYWPLLNHSWYLLALNSVAINPQTNYIDWATVNGRRNLLPTFADAVVSRGQRGSSPRAVNLNFLDRNCYFFFQVAPHLCSPGLSGPRFRPTATQKKSGSAGNRIRGLWVCSQEL